MFYETLFSRHTNKSNKNMDFATTILPNKFKAKYYQPHRFHDHHPLHFSYISSPTKYIRTTLCCLTKKMSRNLLGSIFHAMGEKEPVPLVGLSLTQRRSLSLTRRHSSSEGVDQAVSEVCDLLATRQMADGVVGDIVDCAQGVLWDRSG